MKLRSFLASCGDGGRSHGYDAHADELTHLNVLTEATILITHEECGEEK